MTNAATRAETGSWSRSARSSRRPCAATIVRSGSVVTSSRSCSRAADVDSGLTIARRLLAGALNGGDPSHPIDAFSLSIGVSAFPSPSNLGSLLYRHADAALYWCKRHGRTNAAAFDPGRHGIATDDRSIEDLTEVISTILADEMLRPVYQPIFSLTTGEPVGYECLIRPTEDAPIADASALFAAAERTDRTVELDFACLKVVAEGVGELEPDVYLSVNLSPRTLESELFHPRELTGHLRTPRDPPTQLVVELTEREEVNDLDGLRRNAAACRDAGIRLAADDVGAGNAGLRLLSEIQFDIVKIDLSLVQGGILHDPSYAVLRAHPGARLALAGDDRRRGRRDRRAAGGHPRPRHHHRSGIPPRTAGPRSSGEGDRHRVAPATELGRARRRPGGLARTRSPARDDVASPGTLASTKRRCPLASATR